MNEQDQLTTQEKLLTETAQLSWHDLQVFFARGVVLKVDSTLDLVSVATAVAENDVKQISQWQNDDKLLAPDNEIARSWYKENKTLWAVVVAPFVLVQDK